MKSEGVIQLKTRNVLTAAAAAAALSAGFAAFAQSSYEPAPADVALVPGELIYVTPLNQPEGPIHGGYATYADQQLLSEAIGALASDRPSNGAIVTMVANNGELTVNGSTTSVAQGSRIEGVLKRLHGGTRVTAWFDSPGA